MRVGSRETRLRMLYCLGHKGIGIGDKTQVKRPRISCFEVQLFATFIDQGVLLLRRELANGNKYWRG